MRILRFLNVAILSVLMGSAVLIYAQDEKPADKPAQPEEAKPMPKPNEAKPAQSQEEAKPPKQEEKQQKQEEKQSRDQAMPDQNHPGQPAAQTQGNPNQPEQAHAMPAGKGGHIPDNQFHAHFGREHTFTASTVIVSGQPQFQYGGYSFQLVEAWPVGWAYTDSCYIDFIDGEYFLFDLLHPGVQIAVIVVM
jgi:hypothetical protein